MVLPCDVNETILSCSENLTEPTDATVILIVFSVISAFANNAVSLFGAVAGIV